MTATPTLQQNAASVEEKDGSLEKKASSLEEKAVAPESADPPTNASEYQDAEENYQPRTLKFWTILLSMWFSLFLVALDRMIIATAIPRITDEFKAINDIGWYGSAYMITAACFFPIFGRIYQLYSTKWMYISSIVVFEIGSAICGAAPNSIAFIVGRAIAGSGSSGIFSGSFVLMMPLIPLRKRPTYTAAFGLIFGISSVLGPIVGGLFTDHVTWRWCFYINLPIGALTIFSILVLFNLEGVKIKEVPSVWEQVKRLDPVGVFVFVPSMVCLILALQWGGSEYAWSEPRIIGLLVTFGVLILIFIIYEALTPDTAMIPPRIIMNRSIAGAMLFMFFVAGAMMTTIYYLTIWFQTAKGDSAMQSGIKTIPIVVGMFIFAGISAKFTERVGYYVPAMILGTVLSSVAVGMLSTMTEKSGQSEWIGYEALYGFGIGCGFQGPNLAAQTVLSRVDVPIGVSLMFFMQQLGGGVFIPVGQNIFANQLAKRLSGVAGLNTDIILHSGATNLQTVVPAEALDFVIKVYSYSLTRVFVLAAGLSAATIVGALLLEWRSIKGKPEN